MEGVSGMMNSYETAVPTSESQRRPNGGRFCELLFSEGELEKMQRLRDRSRTLDAHDESLMTRISKKKYLNDRETIAREQDVVVRTVTDAVRNRVSPEELSRFVRPEDAEVLGLEPDDLSDDDFVRLLEADSRKKSVMREICDATNSFLDGAMQEAVYDALLFESVDPSVREDYLDRNRNKREKIGSIVISRELPHVDYEYFDPEADLRKIYSFTKEERMSFSQEAYVEEKRRRIQEYKRRLVEQIRGVTRLHVELEDILLEPGVYDETRTDRLRGCVMKNAGRLRLCPIQMARYEDFFRRLLEWNKQIDTTQGDLVPGRDDAKIYEALFGTHPMGTVKVVRGPICISVECYDPQDFRAACKDPVGIDGEIGGFANEFKVVLLNENGNESAYEIETTRIHEERHSLKKLLNGIRDGYVSYESLDEKTRYRLKHDNMLACIEHDVKRLKERVKEELFAYLKEGFFSDMDEIHDLILQKRSDGGTYDYFEDERDFYHEYDGFDNMDELDTNINREKEQYRQTVHSVFDIVKKLSILGMSDRQIIVYFEFEPLDMWGRVVVRLEEDGMFSEQRRFSIDWYDKKIDDYTEKLNTATDKEKNDKISEEIRYFERCKSLIAEPFHR